ncbi:MAG: sugar phosphate isomerase/epimerase [Phycisphaerae bacterium]|nr:sugar phosphate isomerase/epimerase [Phycisphaerae bacterium]
MQPLQIGVCSWSLAIPDLAQTLATVRDQLGLKLVHLGIFDEGWRDPDRVLKIVEDSGVEASATCVAFAGEDYASIARIAATGGFKPDDVWADRRAKTMGVAEITARLGLKHLMTHIGFVPHDPRDPQYAVMVDRIKDICDALGQRGISLVMETGQEKVQDLIAFIGRVERPNIAVNFDPANMILYGAGEPIEAVEALGSRIVHVHMKDATWSKAPGKDWGAEVVLGTGEADIPRVVSKLRAQGYRGPLVIEREAGQQRLADIREAVKLLESLVG